MAVHEDLHGWLLDRPLWQQELARQLLVQTDLEEDALEAITDLILASVDDEAPDPELRPLGLEDFPTASAGISARLKSVGSLEGVAAAARGQTIDIESHGLTVVYGANGAGKSTYVRVLKRVLRTVDTENVLRSDVYADSISEEQAATAVLGVLRGAVEEAIRVNLHQPEDLGLETISVFDSQSAEIYLDAQNEIAYVPLPIRLLARMAATQDALRERLAARRQQILEAEPRFEAVPAGTQAARRIASLSEATNLQDLSEFARLGEAAEERLTEVRAALAGAGTRDARADAEAAWNDAKGAEELLGGLRRVADALTEASMAALRTAAEEAREARQAVEEAATALADRDGAVGTETWRRMWEAARQLTTNHGRGFPPSEGEPCPLCLRLTDVETASRFGAFETHVQGALEDQASAAEERVRDLLEPITPIHLEALRQLAATSIGDKNTGLDGLVRSAIDLAVEASDRANQDPENAPSTVLPTPEEGLLDWRNQRRRHAETLQATLSPESHAVLQEELAELEARKVLGSQLTQVAEWVGALGRARLLDLAHSALATNSLTTKQRQLSEMVVTDGVGTNLQAELQALRCAHLPVNLAAHTARGRTNVELTLRGAHGAPAVSDVLSEGEQRALALAFFLAEVGCAEHDGGVVLDDPVSSLDDERKGYIARRVVELCSSRQVVVFTHDLPFMLELAELAKDHDVTHVVRGIWRLTSTVGMVDDEPPFQAMKLKQRIRKLKRQVQEWDSGPAPSSEDEAWRRVCDFYAQMRVTWERAVEERLFRGVIQRFQREVKTQSLGQIDIRPELVGSVNEGMTRCSFFVHDPPAGTRTVIPGRADLEADLEMLEAFEKQTS